MALYWPKQNIAFDIVDDPYSAPIEKDAFPGIAVIPMTRAQMGDARTMDRVIRILGGSETTEEGGGVRCAQRRLRRLLAR